MAIIPKKKANIVSNIFCPRNFTRSIKNELKILNITPIHIGKSNRICNAIAEPNTY